MSLELFYVADVSTKHISALDAKHLKEDAAYGVVGSELKQDSTARLVVIAYDTGFFVIVEPWLGGDELAGLLIRYSPELLTLIKEADTDEAVAIRLDSAGTAYKDKKTFDW